MEEFVAYRAETDRRFAELAEAQRRTEGHFEQPAEAQRRTSLSPAGAPWSGASGGRARKTCPSGGRGSFGSLARL